MKKILVKIPKEKIPYNSLQEIAEVFGIEMGSFLKIITKSEKMYTLIRLLKKDRVSFRDIHAPYAELKSIQRLILDKVLISVPLPSYVFGFGPGKSIIENAVLHKSNPYLLNVDIRDFFPSVHYKKIEKIYIELGLSKEISFALMKLTTIDKALPQGAPTSPYLASLALNSMDVRIKSLCMKNRLKYSRYFDDITISGGPRAHSILSKLDEIVQNEGYKIHTSGDKIRTPGPGESKIVTGITICPNGELAVSFIETETYLEELVKNGLSALRTNNPEKERESLRGKINFIGQVNKPRGLKLMAMFKKVEW